MKHPARSWTNLLLALSVLAVWLLRRLDVPPDIADGVVTALLALAGARRVGDYRREAENPSPMSRRPRSGLPPVIMLLLGLAVLLVSCGRLDVNAERSADILLKPSAPHLLRSTVDGVVRYEQRGPMALTIPGWCRCADKPPEPEVKP